MWICANVLRAYASHHIFILEAAPVVFRQTHIHLSSFATLSVYSAWPYVCLSEFPDCVPACLPVLCVRLFIFLPVCLPALWSQATRAFLIASSLLQHQNTVKQSTAVQSASRKSRQTETEQEEKLALLSAFPSALSQCTILHRHDSLFFISLVWFAPRILVWKCVHLQGGQGGKKSRGVNRAFSPHTCVGESKRHSIRVFSLTRGLRTIFGLLISHWGESETDIRHKNTFNYINRSCFAGCFHSMLCYSILSILESETNSCSHWRIDTSSKYHYHIKVPELYYLFKFPQCP